MYKSTPYFTNHNTIGVVSRGLAPKEGGLTLPGGWLCPQTLDNGPTSKARGTTRQHGNHYQAVFSYYTTAQWHNSLAITVYVNTGLFLVFHFR